MTAFYSDEDADLMAHCATATSPPAAPGTFRWAPMEATNIPPVELRSLSFMEAYRMAERVRDVAFDRLKALRVAPGDIVGVNLDIDITAAK